VQTIIAIALFGAIGCLSRYWVSGWLYTLLGRAFPVGTFAVNVIGAFCIGLVMEFSLRSTLIPPPLRVGITIGLLGGLTTFSSFSYETFRLLEEGNFLIATANVVLNVLTCLLFTWGGITAARYL
jgi:CrcB protein